MAQRKALDVDEEEALVAEEEALLASADTHARASLHAAAAALLGIYKPAGRLHVPLTMG